MKETEEAVTTVSQLKAEIDAANAIIQGSEKKVKEMEDRLRKALSQKKQRWSCDRNSTVINTLGTLALGC